MYAYFKHGREPLSSYTHFWGAAAGVLGILALLLRAHQAGAGGMALAGALVFGVSLVALYAADFAFSMRRALHAAAPKEAPAAPSCHLRVRQKSVRAPYRSWSW